MLYYCWYLRPSALSALVSQMLRHCAFLISSYLSQTSLEWVCSECHTDIKKWRYAVSNQKISIVFNILFSFVNLAGLGSFITFFTFFYYCQNSRETSQKNWYWITFATMAILCKNFYPNFRTVKYRSFREKDSFLLTMILSL